MTHWSLFTDAFLDNTEIKTHLKKQVLSLLLQLEMLQGMQKI